MASGLSAVFVLALCVLLPPCVSADNDCKGFKDVWSGYYRAPQKCYGPTYCCGTCGNRYCCYALHLKLDQEACNRTHQYNTPRSGTVSASGVPIAGKDCKGFKNVWSGLNQAPQKCYGPTYCCGACDNRYCCYEPSLKLDQEACVLQDSASSQLPMILGIVISISIICVLVFIGCFFCPSCYLYKKCRKPRPVIDSTTHTTLVTVPQQYPQQQVVTPGQPAGYQYPPYQDTPMQPGYGPQPVPQSYGPQPTVPYQPPAQPQFNAPQFNAPPSQTDYLTQPVYNPDYVGPQPKTG